MSAPEYPSYPNDPTLASKPDLNSGDTDTLVDTAKADISSLGEEVSHQVAAVGEEAKAQVGELAEKAKGMAGEQKDLLAAQLSGVSDAIEKVAGELEGRNETSAQYVRLVADGANRLTSTLRDNSVDEILAIAQDFGRKQPAAFLGAAALLGFAASRFVLASAHRERTQSRNEAANASGRFASDSTALAPDYEQSVGGTDAGI